MKAPSREPVPPPGTPTLPVIAARVKMARDWFSPFCWRCADQPCMTATVPARPIWRARSTMVPTGIPVIGEAHSGVFSTPSGPSPMT